MPISIPEPTPLFPPHSPITQLPIFAWRAYTGASGGVPTSITSVGRGTDMSAIPQNIFAMVYYHDPVAPEDPAAEVKTLDYGDVRPYTYILPDGTTRVSNTAILKANYDALVLQLFNDLDRYPV